MRAGFVAAARRMRRGSGGGATYTKYRLNVTDGYSGFWTGIPELEIRASVGGADTTDGAGNTYFQSVGSGGALGTAANAFDNNTGTSWQVGFDAAPTNYPHIIGVDYSAGTPINAAQYVVTGETGGSPKSWTFEGWNSTLGSWVVLDTRVLGVGEASNGTPQSYTLP